MRALIIRNIVVSYLEKLPFVKRTPPNDDQIFGTSSSGEFLHSIYAGFWENCLHRNLIGGKVWVHAMAYSYRDRARLMATFSPQPATLSLLALNGEHGNGSNK